MVKKRASPPKIRTILVPTDFSDYSERALSYAEVLGKNVGARIVLLHVIDALSFVVTESLQWEDIYRRLRASAKPLLEGQVRKTEKKGLPAAYDLVQGAPYDQIVKKAGEIGADLIVMGTHGRTGMSHLLLGSVAERVVRLAPCPVLTVR
jgi:glycine betaine transporter